MLTFTTEKTVTAIKRQSYSGTPAKSTYSTIGTATCYLRPLTEEQASMNQMQYGLGFSAIFETSVDVLEGDKLVISDVTYTVRGVVNHDRGFNTQYKRVLLMKIESIVSVDSFLLLQDNSYLLLQDGSELLLQS